MTDTVLNNRRRRERALREVLGDEVYRRNRAGIDNAEAVREAARFIRQMRQHAKLSQTALAERIGVTQARISEIERGDSPEGVSYAVLRRVAKACGFANWPMSPIEGIAGDQANPTRTVEDSARYSSGKIYTSSGPSVICESCNVLGFHGGNSNEFEVQMKINGKRVKAVKVIGAGAYAYEMASGFSPNAQGFGYEALNAVKINDFAKVK